MMPLLCLTAGALLGPAPAADATFFEAKIRPVLATHCFRCHGPAKSSSGLRLDSREAMVKGGDHGPALLPGSPEKSLLMQAVQHTHAKLKMPSDGKKLPAREIADLAAWIQGGASWPEATAKNEVASDPKTHWAFQPVRPVKPPDDPARWATHPIDKFLAAGGLQHDLKPVALADRRTLLRRATFDLIGLPPTPEEMDAFSRDGSRDAFARVVDRLLASPRYGERWGRHWMDVVRYADTAGDNADYPIPEIIRYRDYIIDAFNADMPFDQFIREQLAGDIVAKQGPPEKYADRVVATGFLALSRRYATAPYEFWHLTLEDTIDTTGQAFLGLTLRCARCHDHKFDPITRKDYYGLYGIFAATQFPWAGGEEFASMKKPREKFAALAPDAEPKLAAFKTRLKHLEDEIKRVEKQLATLSKEDNDTRTILQKTLAAHQLETKKLHRNGYPLDLPSAYAVADGKPIETRIHLQGDPEKPGSVAPRSVIRFLEGKPVTFPPDGSGRLELAQWITRPDHPLTARVLVNRVWQYHFGRGLVPTPNNFGLRGEPCSHPELLDHLATEFVKGEWSIKKLHRHIMLSKAYQLASTDERANAAKDPGNKYWWRFDRRRLDAEALRDALLFVSGKLDLNRPGPHPFPPITSWSWTQHNPFKDVYASNHRSVYLMTQRIQRHPFLALFDGPDTNASTEKRTSSIVPLQALYLMNHPFVKEQAEGLATKVLTSSRSPEERIAKAYSWCYARQPTQPETAKGLAYLHSHREASQRAGAPSDRVEFEAWTSYARVLLMASEFTFVD